MQTPSGPIHFIEDQEIDFEKVLSTGPTLTLGKGVGWTAHWLAVEGVQPAVPQNPSPAELGAGPTAASTAVNGDGPAISAKPAIQSSATAGTMPLSPLTSSSVAVGGAGVAVKPLIKHVLSRELQLYYERLTTAILTPPSSANTQGEETSLDGDADADAEGDARTSAMDVDGDAQMTSTMSGKENGVSRTGTMGGASTSLEDFARRSSGNLVRDAALASLRGDPGLHQLVPYLMQWVGERISYGVLDVELLSSMMMVVHSLLANPHLHITPYVSASAFRVFLLPLMSRSLQLHQLVPSVLSGLLTASVSPIAGSNKESTRRMSSYQLRCHAGSLLAYITNTYSTAYPSLRTRIVATLLRALLAGTRKYIDPDSEGQPPKTGADAVAEAEAKQRSPVESAGTKLGAVIGLRRMGTAVVRTFLLTETGIQEPEKAKNPLYLLGRWLEDHSPDDQDALWLVREVKAAAYSLTAPLLPAGRSVEQEEEMLEENYGTYWLGQLGDDIRARKGLLSVREEAAQPTGAVS